MASIHITISEEATPHVTTDAFEEYLCYLQQFDVPIEKVRHKDATTVEVRLCGPDVTLGQVDRIAEGFDLHVTEIPKPEVENINIRTEA